MRMCTTAPAHVAPAAESDTHMVQLPLGESLLPSLDVFHRCSTKWGLVTGVRADGTTYQRHVVVVELSANIAKVVKTVAINKSSDWKMRRIRQAIDLVKLALAVDPHALMPLLLRRSLDKESGGEDDTNSSELDEDTLEMLTRSDAPFELRLRLELRTKRRDSLSWLLVSRFMQKLDNENIHRRQSTSTALRSYLVDQARSKPSALRLIELPIRTTLVVEVFSGLGEGAMMVADDSVDFFTKWASAADALAVHQHHRAKKWYIDKNLAPFDVESIELDMEVVPVTTEVIEAVSAGMNKGIPVSCSYVCLDYRHVRCEEHELSDFLEAITEHNSGPIVINTGPTLHRVYERAPFDEADYAGKILMVFRCIGELDHAVVVEIGPLLVACRTRRNREAVIRGLVEFVLTRDKSTSLSFEDCDLISTVAGELGRIVDQQARYWRMNHGDKILRLKSLEWSPNGEGVDFIRALLRALDDVEEVELETIPGEEFTSGDVKAILRYPNLRCLRIDLPIIPTMDIFVTARKGRATPALERLELNGVKLGDSASVTRFIKRLDPNRANASALSRTLQCFGIAEGQDSDDEDSDDEGSDESEPHEHLEGVPHVRREGVHRAVNDPAAVRTLRSVLATNKVLQHVDFLGDFTHRPVRLTPKPCRRSRNGHISAPAEVHRSDVAKARNAAFLSALRDGDVRASRSVDSIVVGLIFAFAAPHVYRCIRI